MKVSEALFEPLLEDLFESEEAEGAVGALFEGMAESALSSEGGMSAKNTCIMHLKHIDGAKQQWAIDNRKNAVDMPTKSDLYGRSKYIKAEPKCPEGGAYTIRNIGEDPTCSLGASHGHSL